LLCFERDEFGYAFLLKYRCVPNIRMPEISAKGLRRGYHGDTEDTEYIGNCIQYGGRKKGTEAVLELSRFKSARRVRCLLYDCHIR
jgi:hypothetical protein